MAIKIIHKKSSVASRVPVFTDLEYGELAINYEDGVLYFRDSADNVKVLSSINSNILTGEYKFDTTTASADPGSGKLRFNSGTRSAVTEIYVDQLSNLKTDVSVIVSGLVSGDTLVFQNKSSAADRVRYQISGAATDNTGWWTIPVTWVSEAGSLWANNTTLAVVVQYGSGAASSTLETEFNFSNSTTAADPGSGNLRLNDSTFAASVEIYLDSISYLGNDIAVLLAPMRTNDLIILYSKTAPTNFAKYRLISASTDNTGWWTLQVTLVESSGAFWANDTKLMAVVEHADASTGTGRVAREGSPELSSPIIVNEATPTPANGMIYQDSTSGKIRVYEKGAWAEIVGFTNRSTGVISGGVLSVGTPNSTVSISDGSGVIIDHTTDPENPTDIQVSWTGKANIPLTYLASNLITFLAIDSTGTVIQQTNPFSSAQRRDVIVLGVAVHVDNTIVNTVNQEQHAAIGPVTQIHDLAEAIGFFNIRGNSFLQGGSGGLYIQKTAGDVFAIGSNWAISPKNPNVLTLDSEDDIPFQYRTQNGTNRIGSPYGELVIDPDIWDDGGTITALANNKWTTQRIYVFLSGDVKIQPGQMECGSQAECLNSISTANFVTEPTILANGLLRGFLIIKKGTTDLADAIFVEAEKFGSSTGTGTSAGSTFADTAFEIYDGSDSSKVVKFEADGLTSGISRTLTVQDADGTIALAEDLVIGTDVQAHSSVLDNTTASFQTADETKLDYLTVTQAVDLDALETKLDHITVTQAVDLDALETKLDHITVTQAVDLDTIESRVNALDAAVVLKGTWDASSGSFPGGGTAQAGDSYIVSVAGTVDSVDFSINDRLLAILDNASTSTYAANWIKLDYTDQVLSVFGRPGAVTAENNDYTWAQINKATSSLADITTRSAADLSSGILPDARMPNLTGDVTTSEGSVDTTLLASTVLSKLLTVDGSGSLLDADLLDGNHASAFAVSAHTHNLTGPITSVGLETSVASQTGTGSKFVMDTNPTFAADITVTGDIYASGTKLEGDSKEMIRFSDAWLRLNPANEFSSGIYCGTGILRTDGTLQVGGAGATLNVIQGGDMSFKTDLMYWDYSADRVGINNTTPSYTLDVTGEARFTGGIIPRVNGTTSSTTMAPNAGTSDIWQHTAQAANITTVSAPTGTARDGQKLILRIYASGGARTISGWNAIYTDGAVTFPTTINSGKWTYIGFIYNGNNSKWNLVAVTENIDPT